MKFKASLCDPLNPVVIELGELEKEQVMPTFEEISWGELLHKMQGVSEEEIYFSPSFEVENKSNQHGLCVSAIDGTEWYIFYKRPKMVKKRSWFKTTEYWDKEFLSDITGQSIDDVRQCLNALLMGNTDFLEQKIK